MDIISEEEMAMRIDYRSPLPKQESTSDIPERQSVYSIPFEYGANPKGCVISVALAKQIAAELRAEIAEWDKRDIFRAFKQEQARSKRLEDLSAAKETELFEARHTIAQLERRLRARATKIRNSSMYGRKK